MPACPRDKQYSTSPPPGFTDMNTTFKREQVIDLLRKVIEKCQDEPVFLAQQPKEIDLLVSIAQLTLLSSPNSATDRQDFLNNIMSLAQDLLTNENNTDTNSSVDLCPSSNENTVPCSTILPSDATTNDTEGDFSLDDLANEYLQNEPTPPSSNEKPTTSSESEEPDLSIDSLPSTPITNVLSALVSPVPLPEPVLLKPSLESILFSNHLSSHAAAADADKVWKEASSTFGQLFCKKTEDINSIVTKRISTCLLDRSLYERLTRLIILLPKQCMRNSVPQLIIRPNEQSHRPPRHYNNEYRRPSHRPSFQQNSLQSHPMGRYPNSQNPRPYYNQNYSNQQGNPNGHFIDRRSQQPYQQQNGYPQAYPADQQYRQRGPPRNNTYQQQPQQQQNRKQQPNNQNEQQQRGPPRKGFGGGNRPNPNPNPN